MSDLDITIALDPGPAATSARKVTEEVKKTETAAKEATTSVKSLGQQLANVETQAAKAAKAAGSINFKQAAQGAKQAFALLNNELHITELLNKKLGHSIGDAINSAVTFGATGAQIAGPWGAAIGTLIGLTASFGDEILSIIDGGAHERRMKQYAEEIERNEKLIELIREQKQIYSDVVDETERLAVARARAFSDMVANARFGAGDAPQERVRALRLALFQEQRQRESMGFTSPNNTELSIARQLRDAIAELDLSSKSYGKTVLAIETEQRRRLDTEIDLKKAYDEGAITLEVYNREMAKLYGNTQKVADGFKLWHGILVKITEEQRNMAVARSPGIQSATGGIAIPQASGVPAPSGVDGDMERMRQGAAVARQEWEKTQEAARKAFEESNKWSTLIADQIKGSAVEFSSVLVDAANGADVSWKSFFSSMLQQFEKAIAQALILQALTGSITGAKGPGGYGGLFGVFGLATGGDLMVTSSGLRRLPAAATGADWMVGGRGGTDSQLVAFRASPNESVHVRTPEQRRAAASASGGGNTINNNISLDPRALIAINNSPEGRRSIVNAIVLDAPVIRRALGIR